MTSAAVKLATHEQSRPCCYRVARRGSACSLGVKLVRSSPATITLPCGTTAEPPHGLQHVFPTPTPLTMEAALTTYPPPFRGCDAEQPHGARSNVKYPIVPPFLDTARIRSERANFERDSMDKRLIEGILFFLAFMACIPIANWMI